ncbi:hypothetical protein VTH06DRAFT_1004 [Thermothelomyces fergusii]
MATDPSRTEARWFPSHPSGMSDYCNTNRMEVKLPDGSSQVFLEKEGPSEEGYGCVQSA